MMPAFAPAKQAPQTHQAGKAVLLLEPVLLGRPAAARCLGLSLSTLDGLVSDGSLRSVMVRGRRMIRPADLRDFAAGLPAAPGRGAAQDRSQENLDGEA